jgi:hypothetical protein
MKMKFISCLVAVITLCISFIFPSTVLAARFNVFVVMSYEQDNPWCQEIKQGIDSVLSGVRKLSKVLTRFFQTVVR